jgi:hypothetical protein
MTSFMRIPVNRRRNIERVRLTHISSVNAKNGDLRRRTNSRLMEISDVHSSLLCRQPARNLDVDLERRN